MNAPALSKAQQIAARTTRQGWSISVGPLTVPPGGSYDTVIRAAVTAFPAYAHITGTTAKAQLEVAIQCAVAAAPLLNPNQPKFMVQLNGFSSEGAVRMGGQQDHVHSDVYGVNS
jgi:hypothetical protein